MSWFKRRNGTIFLNGPMLCKDRRQPDIPVMLGAWEKLEPIVARRRQAEGEEAYLLEGHATERQEVTFRRLGEWMRIRGWATQKAIHEFRAWAGCQVAMQHSLQQAQLWMRHKSYATTEKFYGRYIKLSRISTKLEIPEIPGLQILRQPDPSSLEAS